MIFVGATFGANSLNKAISVFGEQRRYTDDYQYQDRQPEERDDIVEKIK